MPHAPAKTRSVSGRVASILLRLTATCTSAATGLSELIVAHAASEGEVSKSTLVSIISKAAATGPEERELLLQLQLDLLDKYVASDGNQDRAAALRLGAAIVSEARALYGKDDAMLIPVLQRAAKASLRYRDFNNAIALLNDALRISGVVHTPEDPATRFVMRDLGRAYAAQGDAVRSKKLIEQADYLALLAPASLEGITVLAGSQPSAEKPYRLVPVFFQTTREKTGDEDPQTFFGVKRAGSSYGVSYVSVPHRRESGSIPQPSILKFDFSTDPHRHVVLKAVSLYDGQAALLKAVKDGNDKSSRKESLLFIHGFNQSFVDGVQTAATLAVDLEIDGTVIAYSWPSKNNVLKYVADTDEATSTANREALKELLVHLSGSVGARSVYVIAHSMGNRLLLEAMKLMPGAGATSPLTNVVFASPDVESAEFETVVGNVRTQASSMTLYTAASDIPLGLSETIRNGLFGAKELRRAGDRNGGVQAQPYLDVIDASKAQADWLGHSNFTQLAKDDLRALLWLRIPARKRCVLVAQQPGWRYEPREGCTSESFGMAALYYRRLNDPGQAAGQLANRGDPAARLAGTILKNMLSPAD